MNKQNEIPVRLFVVYRINKSIAEGIFTEYVQNGSLTVEKSGTSSSAISRGEYWLLTTEDASVALALDCSGNAEEFRTPIQNIFTRDAREERWHIALAIPDMTKWLLSDPKFAEAADQAQVPRTLTELARYFEQWVSEPGNQFNREEVSKRDAEFAGLNQFIEEHALSTTGTVES